LCTVSTAPHRILECLARRTLYGLGRRDLDRAPVAGLRPTRQARAPMENEPKLDRLDLIILDDLSYARKDQAEPSVLFELIAKRYERKNLLITANQPLPCWNDVFPNAHISSPQSTGASLIR
jgi:hypothetical protein